MIYYRHSEYGLLTVNHGDDVAPHHAANISIPAGVRYALSDVEPTIFPFVSDGVTGWTVKQLQIKIMEIQSVPMPELLPYAEPPINTDNEQIAELDAIYCEEIPMLPVTEPFMTQEDMANAMANVNAIQAHNARVAQAEAGLRLYADALEAYQADCARIDAENAEAQAKETERRNSQIAILQNEITRLQEG
jgi:hypothetical protein